MKKLSIIGRGTAGLLTACHFNYYTDYEIEVFYSSDIKEQSVGEGVTVNVLWYFEKYGLTFDTMYKVLATHKDTIEYINWNKEQDYHHHFTYGLSSMHFSAVDLQPFLQKQLEDKGVKFIDKKINIDDLDSDYIIDCSGFPDNYDNYYISDAIPVNSALVQQYAWEYPQFIHSKAKAMKNGWMFGIPLQNRVSFGYLYNSSISNLENIKNEMDKDLIDYSKPNNVKNINFNNYYSKNNFTDGRIVRNGNASFFLEPMEATSLASAIYISQWAYDIWEEGYSPKSRQIAYETYFKDVESMISMHYLAPKHLKSKFWKLARKKAKNHLPNSTFYFKNIATTNNEEDFNLDKYKDEVGTWGVRSYIENINGLNIRKDLNKLLK